MKNLFKTLLVTVSLSHFASAGFAAVANIQVGSGLSNVFVPATTNISMGDQVIWTWGGNFHSTTSGTTSGTTAFPDGLWDSGVANAPHAFTNTFNSTGTFPFYCSVHFSSGMKGSIVVAGGADVPPTVSLTSPTNGTVLSEPADVSIQATASDSDGTVTNVQFLVGTTVLTDQSLAPFAATTNNLPAGNYTLSAIATDNGGLKATNSVNISVVTPVLLTLSSAQWLPPSSFQFSYAVNIGLRYAVQRTTNLMSPGWTALVTNTATNNLMPFIDSDAPAGLGFYRVERMPNP